MTHRTMSKRSTILAFVIPVKRHCIGRGENTIRKWFNPVTQAPQISALPTELNPIENGFDCTYAAKLLDCRNIHLILFHFLSVSGDLFHFAGVHILRPSTLSVVYTTGTSFKSFCIHLNRKKNIRVTTSSPQNVLLWYQINNKQFFVLGIFN